jgi:hypothetical protein
MGADRLPKLLDQARCRLRPSGEVEVRSRPIRYLDDFVKQDEPWFFAERRLMINWIDTRPLQA